VASLLAGTSHDDGWCASLEQLVVDPIVGKVLCVCASIGIAHSVVTRAGSKHLLPVLSLLNAWVDQPSDHHFRELEQFLASFEPLPEDSAAETIWWALRSATCTVGNFEAEWALHSACSAAARAGLSPREISEAAAAELRGRRAA
jgi:hypothetical protein